MSADTPRDFSIWFGVAFGLFLAWLLYLVLRPLLAPIIWALLLVHLFWPLHRRLLLRLPRWPNFEALLVSLAVVVMLILPTALLATLIAREAISASQRLADLLQSDQPNWLTQLQQHPTVQSALVWLREIRQDGSADLQSSILEAARQASVFVASQLSHILGNLVGFVFAVGITTLTMFFLFRDGAAWLAWARGLIPIRQATQQVVLTQIDQTVTAVFYGNLAVAATQGLLGGIGFWIVGLPSVILWASVMAVLSLIPVLGSFLIWLPAAIILLLQGETWRGLFVIGWGVLIVGLADNLLRPLVIGAQARLPTLMIFLSLIGGIQAFGVLGLVVGPLTVAVTLALLEAHEATLRDRSPR
jgi:predicted PurR-regulated permease PerM